jgi:hypothetical protein
MGYVIEGDAGLFARFDHGFITHRADPREATVFFSRNEAIASNVNYGRRIGRVISYDQALINSWFNRHKRQPA